MKRFALLLVLSCLALAGLFACSDDLEGPDKPEGLTGVWQWVETCYPMPVDCNTPETLGYDVRLLFTADSIFMKWIDDEVQDQCGFGTFNGDIGDGITRPLLTFECTGDTLVFLFEDDNTLTLSLGMPGSAVERYTRVIAGD